MLVLLLAGPAAAAEPSPPPGSPVAVREATRLVGQAEALEDDGRLTEALDLANHAAELAPNTGAPQGLLGKLYLKIGDCAQAITHLARFVRLGDDAKKIGRARKLIKECTTNRKRWGTLMVRVTPPESALRVFRLGGETPVAAGLGAVEAELPSGTYRLQASLPGRSDLDTKARVLARQVTEVTYQGDRKVGDRP